MNINCSTKFFYKSVLVALLIIGSSNICAEDMSAASQFGTYDGEVFYSQYIRRSQYVKVNDGTPLAVDIFVPAVEEKPVQAKLPTIFYYSRYWRAKETPDGTIMTNLGPWRRGQKVGVLQHRDASGRLIFWDTGRESIVDMMRRGYAFVRAESRGSGASGGIRDGELSLTEAKDGAELIAWIAQQTWSNGRVGMIGGSYPGMTQLKVAAEAPPALVAIFPAVPVLDFYQLIAGGSGILHKAIMSFSRGQAAKDGLTEGKFEYRVVPVDDDSDRTVLDKILEKRRTNSPRDAIAVMLPDLGAEFAGTIVKLSKQLGYKSLAETMGLLMSPPLLQKAVMGKPQLQEEIARGLHLYRDTPAFSTSRENGMVSPHAVLDAINKAAIPTYIWTGWFDQDTIGAFNLYESLTMPKRITAGTWTHGPNEDNGIADGVLDSYEAQARELLNAEMLRWFDYWLKGLDTGIMNEPPIHYSYEVSPRKLKWRTATKWPLTDTSRADFFLTGDHSAADQLSDGGLSPTLAGSDELGLKVDYTKTMGSRTRVHDAMSSVPAMRYPDLKAHASGEGALVFTSETLSSNMLLAGNPVLTLYASSTAIDGDLFAYLEEVDASGNAQYLTEATVRASHRKTGKLSYTHGGGAYSLSDRASVAATAPFDNGEVELRFVMQPTANLFEKGHAVRLVITGGDMHNYMTPVFSPAPEITVKTGGEKASILRLPFVKVDK